MKIKVLTLNMKQVFCKLDLLLEHLRNNKADVILLQEATAAYWWPFKKGDPAKWLAHKLGYNYVSCIMNGSWAWGWKLAILTWLPILDSYEYHFDFDTGDWRRSVLTAKIEVGPNDGNYIRVVSLHHGMENHVRQVQNTIWSLGKWLPGKGDIIGGDFNNYEGHDDAAFGLLRQRGFIDAWVTGQGSSTTFPASGKRIDRMFVGGQARPRSARVVLCGPDAVSDHCAVVAEMEV